jgi:hypothetical protein
MPTLASSSRVQLAYIKETAFGVTPVTGNGRYLRMTGESLDFNLNKIAAKEIRSDRQIAGATSTDADLAGGFNFHMQFAEYDQLVEGALQNLYAAYGTNGVGSVFTAAITATTITASVAPTTTSAFTTLQPGQFFQYNAVTGLNKGKVFRNSLTVAATPTVITLDASTVGLVESAIATAFLSTSRLTNGTTQMSFSIEKNFADIVQFLTYTGLNVNKMSLSFQPAAITDCVFDFIGSKAARFATTQMPGTIAASQTYDVQNSVKGMTFLWEAGVPLTGTFVKSLTMDFDNMLRGQKALANFGNIGVGVGDFTVTGKAEIYFASGALYDKFLADTYTSLTVSTQDAAGNGYVYTLPRVQFMNAKIVAGAKMQDVMVSFDYTAFSDDANAVAALRKTVFIDRVGLAVPQPV